MESGLVPGEAFIATCAVSPPRRTPITCPPAPASWLPVLLGLSLLLVLCLVPRAIMAWKVPGICPDAVLYIGLGKGFESGPVDQALGNLRFNLFPVILSLLHRLGFGWVAAGT